MSVGEQAKKEVVAKKEKPIWMTESTIQGAIPEPSAAVSVFQTLSGSYELNLNLKISVSRDLQGPSFPVISSFKMTRFFRRMI